MDITFYTYTGEYNLINKFLSGGVMVTGRINDVINYNRPTLNLRTKSVDFNMDWNYCYIHDFNRYYFIDKHTVKSDNTFTVDLNIDLLKTYESDILNATGTIVISDKADKFNSDVAQVYNTKPKVNVLPFDVVEPFDADGNIIMVTIKGI